jgi:hypothetical protein
MVQARKAARIVTEVGHSRWWESVPKWGREILPLSIPETVVGLTPASSASRAWVHIRLSRMTTNLLPTVPLSMLSLSVSIIGLYHITGKKYKEKQKNCPQHV